MSALIVLLLLQRPDIKAATKGIQARYDLLDHAFRKKDPSVLDDYMTDDFTTDSPDGKTLHSKEAASHIKGLMMASQNAKWPRKVTKVTFEGSDAVAIVDGHFEGSIPGPDGKPHVTELTTTVEDTWAHTAKGWRIRRSHMLKMNMKMDGKPSRH
jgi:ketosteroid isomerase-like protein